MGQQFAHQVALPGVGEGVQVMRACVLLAWRWLLVLSSLSGTQFPIVQTRGLGGLRQDEGCPFRASAGVDSSSLQHLTSGWERQGMVTSDLNNGCSRSGASSEQGA